MSQDNYILDLLNIEDKNIKLRKDFYKIEERDGIKYKIIEATLSYEPIYCHRCGCVFDEKQTYEKKKYICHCCNKKFFARTKLVDDFCFISNPVKYAIALDLKNKISEKDIAKRYRVSPNTVERIIDSYYEGKKLYKNYLPEILSFDEFKAKIMICKNLLHMKRASA